MYVSGFRSASFASPSRTSASRPRNFPLNEPLVPSSELVDDHPADVVPILRVLAPGVPEAGDEKIQRRAVLSPTEEAHGSLPVGLLVLAGGLGGLLGLAAARPQRRPRPRPPRRPRRRPPRARSTPREIAQVASTVSGSSRYVTPSIAGRSASRSVPPTSSDEMSASMCSGIAGRQGLDAQLARDLLDDAALLRPGRLADELHRDASPGSAGRGAPRGSRRASACRGSGAAGTA